MYLKSLTIQGFKSFANRVTIELPRGVAAVVGPNGSGKSNIADALRWVLGEQSIRLLRGTKLEDVIFAGSDAKRAVGMAEVSVTFDNSSGRIPIAYTEVTATRRVYRSGESDFLINKSPCRLKDIQELFMDTGIGRGSLAIIGQGEVDAILSARPEERRAFLEEAAGISRYQARKDEAVKRLARAQEDLVRVQDILREVERQLGPLESQAKVAEEYERLSQRLAAIEVHLLLQERGRLSERRAAALGKLEQVSKHRDEVRAALREIEERASELAKQMEELDKEIESCREMEERARDAEVEAKHKAEMARARLSQRELESKERERRRADLVEQLAKAERDLAEERRAADAAALSAVEKEQAAERVERELAAVQEALADKERGIRSARDKISALSEKIAALQSRSEAFDREAQAFDEQRAEFKARKERLLAELDALGEERKAKEQALAGIESAFAEARRELDEAEKALSRMRADRERLEKELWAKRRAAAELASKRKAIADMEEAREGYQRGVREVLLAEKTRRWGLVGAVAELIHVPEHLEAAIEVALGQAQQYIVAKTDQSAKLAIEYLKERRLGRATFLPLDSLRPTPLRDDARERLSAIPGVVGVASELVKAKDGCVPAVEYLLGRVVVAETLDTALLVAKRGVPSVSRIVTLDGDVVIPGGAITGGSRSHRSEGLLARGRHLEALAVELAKVEAEIEAASARIARLDEEAEAQRARVTRWEKERRELEIKRISAERDVADARHGISRLEAALAECDASLERLGRKEESARAEVAGASAVVAAMTEEREALRRSVEELERSTADERERQEALRKESEELKVLLAALAGERDRRRREVERLAGEASRLHRAILDEEDAIARAQAGRKESEDEIARALEAADAAGRERAALSARSEELRGLKAGLKSESQELAHKAGMARERLEAAQEEATRLAVECERLEADLARIAEALSERGHEEGKEPDVDPGADDASLRAEAKDLRRRIAALGPVNPAAVEEYRQVKERYEFLRAQRDDLEEARADLAEVIARIDKESAKRLQTVYGELRTAFNDTFRRLFGGGHASLEFTDPDNPLESGLEIFVQPPGKKLQNLMALSGGEKALAAIALLFGILAVRPSPFCVLDEIDAALDEHNVARFRALLEEYAHSTQFLVITHRQPTMEAADCLYGVTMEESGVSTLVSLKLEDARPA